LTPVTPEFCDETIKQVSVMQKDLRVQLGTTFAFLGDEIYLKAGRSVPSRKHYGDYPQIEDGIGMVRSFANQFQLLMRRMDRAGLSETRPSGRVLSGTIMTGTLFAPVLEQLIDRMNQRFRTRLKVVAVRNEYFGGDVSVAGLLTGGDFLAARGEISGDFVIIPRVALKSDEAIMLDGMRFEALREEFDVPLHACDFQDLVSTITGAPN
jgi:NifB/MoaA-like Fe-S oxidoreductase